MKRPFILALLLFALLGCSRDPIMDEVSKYRFDFDLDSAVLYCARSSPELVQVLFYDPLTGKKVEETYLPPEGGCLYSIEAGRYDIVAFTMGSSRTEITYTKDLNLLTAETKTIQSSPQVVINAPDHIFVGVMADVEIPFLSEADPPFSVEIPLRPLCDSWKVVIGSVKGLEYVASVTLEVSNQARDILLRDMLPEGTCSLRSEGSSSAEDGVIEASFCTFAMNPEGAVTMKVTVQGQDRSIHCREFDITSQVRDEGNTLHLIEVDFPLELLPLTQGGLDPTAKEWDESHEFIDIR